MQRALGPVFCLVDIYAPFVHHKPVEGMPMGSRIEQRGKRGTWWYLGFFNGRKFRESLKTTVKNVAEREQRIRDAKYQDPAFMPTRKLNPTVGEFWQEYEAWAIEHRSKATVEVQRHLWNSIITFTKAQRMRDFRPQDFERMKRRRQAMGKAGWSETTCNSALKDFDAIWRRGVNMGWITGESPAAHVERFTVTRREITFHTRQDIEQLLEAAGDDQQLRWAILLMGFAGLRRAEMAFLRWENLVFDAKASFIRIRECDGFRPKTRQERTIPMHRRIFSEMHPFRQESGPVFVSGRKNEGKHRYPYDCKRALTSAIKRAGLPDADPFQRLRRSFGSMLVQEGVSIFKIARWMGHSVKIAEAHYAALLQHDGDIDRI